MKTLYNIFLIFLIGFFSSSFLFTLSPVNYKNTIVIDEEPEQERAVLSLSLDSENSYLNPDNIVISHLSNIEFELLKLPKDIIAADVYRGEELIKSDIIGLVDTSISINDSSYIISPTTPLKTTLNISQEKLGLSDGKYKLILKSNIINTSETNSIEVFIEYDNGFIYYEAINTVPIKKSTGLVLYFADKELNTLIPVSRFSTQNSSVNKQVIYELQQGPKSESLVKTIDAVNQCFYRERDRSIFIDLPGDNTFYNTGSAAGTTAYNSLVKSMFYLSKYYKLDYLKFTVDKKTVDSYFHEISIKDKITKTNNPILYYGYKVEQRLYLIEHELMDFDIKADIKAKSLKMLELYKTEQPLNAKNPIPNDLVINDVKLDKDSLNLDFNDTLLTAFDGDQNNRKFLIDALVYSFTSLQEVKSVKFTVNGNPLENFIEGKDMTKEITRPLYINPEDGL